MTLENISNIDGLFAVINQCTGVEKDEDKVRIFDFILSGEAEK